MTYSRWAYAWVFAMRPDETIQEGASVKSVLPIQMVHAGKPCAFLLAFGSAFQYVTIDVMVLNFSLEKSDLE